MNTYGSGGNASQRKIINRSGHSDFSQRSGGIYPFRCRRTTYKLKGAYRTASRRPGTRYNPLTNTTGGLCKQRPCRAVRDFVRPRRNGQSPSRATRSSVATSPSKWSRRLRS